MQGPYSQYRKPIGLTGRKEKREIHTEGVRVFLRSDMIIVESAKKKGN